MRTGLAIGVRAYEREIVAFLNNYFTDFSNFELGDVDAIFFPEGSAAPMWIPYDYNSKILYHYDFNDLATGEISSTDVPLWPDLIDNPYYASIEYYESFSGLLEGETSSIDISGVWSDLLPIDQLQLDHIDTFDLLPSGITDDSLIVGTPSASGHLIVVEFS